jgi:potassium-dependent mechanosensitive channel
MSHVLRLLLAPWLLLLVLLLGSGTAWAQQPSDLRDRLAAAKATLDSIDAAVQLGPTDDEKLRVLREELEPVRSALVTLQAEVAGPRDKSKLRLDQLGPAPKAEEPPESAEVAESRKAEQALFGELDGIAREAQVQIVRADQLAENITERRRVAFARQLTERVTSVVDPKFWINVLADAPRAWSSLNFVVQAAFGYAVSRITPVTGAWLLAILLASAFLAYFVRGRITLLRERLAAREARSVRFAAAVDAALTIIYRLLGAPLAMVVPVLALKVLGLVPARTLELLGGGAVLSVFVAVAFYATGVGILQVRRPALRLLPLSDWAVARIRRAVQPISLILGLNIFAQSIGTAIIAPISLTVAATAITSFLFAAISTILLLRLRNAPATVPEDGGPAPAEDANKLDILRPILWVVVFAIFACLLSGYVALAGFLAMFPLVVLFTASIAYILMTLIDAGLTESLTGNGQRSRAVASAIGVSSKNVAFSATLLSGLLRFLVLAAAVMILGGPLGFYSADMVSAVQRSFFGFKVGEITISPSGILFGLFLFGLVVVITRLVRGWMHNTLLPRTTLDAGLQNSIATIVGYCGVALAIAVALSEMGLDLQNFAIVAGALSVGIGFGLQSVVSNFVSGLILLAERPIRVGDIINVSGEEGFVRRISVRATEIETYDRATLIIPNSQLITGTVKNWVYGNTWSRVKLSIVVAYGSDIDEVRAAMLEAAQDDPRILPSPPARVFVTRLGEDSIELEMVAVVASVETLAAVKSDMQIRMLRIFAEKDIRMAKQAPAAPAPAVVNLAEVVAALEEARAQLERNEAGVQQPQVSPRTGKSG